MIIPMEILAVLSQTTGAALLQWAYDIPNIAEAAVCTSLLPFTPKVYPRAKIMPYDE